MPSTNVIMPVLGMNQETGKVIKWLAQAGQRVVKGEILLEIETDKAVAEIEAPASGVLTQVTAHEGEDVPVGQAIAVIVPEGEAAEKTTAAATAAISASPVAARMAVEHSLDLAQVRPQGGRVEKADVQAYLQREQAAQPAPAQRTLASPKARRLAAERGISLDGKLGSGPQGAVLAADVLAASQRVQSTDLTQPVVEKADGAPKPALPENEIPLSTTWRIMAERTSTTWTTAPHFYLLREVDTSQLTAWREAAQQDIAQKITYSDLLVKLCAAALGLHPNLNVTFQEGKLRQLSNIHIGLAAAVEDALVVPVLHNADQKSLTEIAAERTALLERSRAGRLRPEDVSGGVFTISNLGMYGVDAFNAVLNGNQTAILAVGRIAERVVAVNGQPAVRPMMILSLSCDHRAVDGARAAQFLNTLAGLIQAPLRLIR
ncbi:MAG TPA: dihydrolipoamide acetyltransferase family protein [Anaerolineales bacterium]